MSDVDCVGVAEEDWRLSEIGSMSLILVDRSVRVLSSETTTLHLLDAFVADEEEEEDDDDDDDAVYDDEVADELDEVDEDTVVVEDALETGVNELNWFKLELLLLDEDAVASDAGDIAVCLRASSLSILVLLLLLRMDISTIPPLDLIAAAVAVSAACCRLICWSLAACAVGMKL